MLRSRLALKLAPAIAGVREVSRLQDPVGAVQLHRELDAGLVLKRVSCPLGVVGVIFEARPEALVQIVSLAIKSANAVILKGLAFCCFLVLLFCGVSMFCFVIEISFRRQRGDADLHGADEGHSHRTVAHPRARGRRAAADHTRPNQGLVGARSLR